MDKYICECCGGQIDPSTMTCRYCGTQYKRDDDRIIRIDTFTNPVHTFKACVAVPNEMMREDFGRELAINSLVSELSNVIPSHMLVASEYDYEHHITRLSGTIKIVHPVNVC